jgi:hypothetical protein
MINLWIVLKSQYSSNLDITNLEIFTNHNGKITITYYKYKDLQHNNKFSYKLQFKMNPIYYVFISLYMIIYLFSVRTHPLHGWILIEAYEKNDDYTLATKQNSIYSNCFKLLLSKTTHSYTMTQHTHLMFNSQCHSHLLDSANTMDLFLPIWTPLLIPLGMKWIQWLWLDQFYLLAFYPLFFTIPCFYQYLHTLPFFLDITCTIFYVYSYSSSIWTLKNCSKCVPLFFFCRTISIIQNRPQNFYILYICHSKKNNTKSTNKLKIDSTYKLVMI